MKSVAAFVAKEFREALPAFVFLFVAFHMVAVTKAVTLEDYEITGAGAAAATVGAMIVAKAVLVIRHLRVSRLFGRRLLYNILWKTLLYSAVATLFRFVEELIHLARKHEGLVAASKHVASDVSWPHFWVMQMWLFSLLFLYELASNLAHVIGLAKVKEILLQPSA